MPATTQRPVDSPRMPADAALPSEEVRGWLSFLLFIHLFAVAVALASYGQPSPLERRLKQVFAPYDSTLNFDLNPNAYPAGRFYLTLGGGTDVDFLIEIEGTLPDGASKTEIIPGAGLWPGERRYFQALANAVGTMSVSENDDLQSILPRSIGGAILKDWGAVKGMIRCRAHQLMPIEDVASSDPAKRDPFDLQYYKTVYEANLLISPTGEVDLVKKAAAAEVAPVEKQNSEKSN